MNPVNEETSKVSQTFVTSSGTGEIFNTDCALYPVETYVSRPALEDKIRAAFPDDSASRLSVWGDLSIGKTQLVLNYAKSSGQRYLGKFCIDCRTPASVAQDLAHIYSYISGGPQCSTLRECILVIQKSFLAQDGPWLIVLSHADSLTQEILDTLLWDEDSIHYIIIGKTKIQGSSLDLQVGNLEEIEALELFYNVSQVTNGQTAHDGSDENRHVKNLVQRLSYSPLAVTLAAKYVKHTPSVQGNIENYFLEYEKQRETVNNSPWKSHQATLIAWEVAYHAARKQFKHSTLQIDLLSWLDSRDNFLMQRAFDPAYPHYQKLLDLTDNMYDVIGNFGLIHWGEGRQGYMIPSLFQSWAHFRLSKDQKCRSVRTALMVLNDAIKKRSTEIQLGPRLYRHVIAFLTNLAQSPEVFSDIGEILIQYLPRIRNFMYSMRLLGVYSRCERRLLQEFRRSLGNGNINTHQMMNIHSGTLCSLGQRVEATQLLREVRLRSMWRQVQIRFQGILAKVGGIQNTG
jgi:hypothetical protein